MCLLELKTAQYQFQFLRFLLILISDIYTSLGITRTYCPTFQNPLSAHHFMPGATCLPFIICNIIVSSSTVNYFLNTS